MSVLLANTPSSLLKNRILRDGIARDMLDDSDSWRSAIKVQFGRSFDSCVEMLNAILSQEEGCEAFVLRILETDRHARADELWNASVACGMDEFKSVGISWHDYHPEWHYGTFERWQRENDECDHECPRCGHMFNE